MSATDRAEPRIYENPGILDRERIVAKAGFNRWLVPPASVSSNRSPVRISTF